MEILRHSLLTPFPPRLSNENESREEKKEINGIDTKGGSE